MTFFLVFAIFAIAVDDRGALKAVSGFGIGLVITVAVLAGGPLTGAAMNPARALRPRARLPGLGELHLDLLPRPVRRRRHRSRRLRVALPPPVGGGAGLHLVARLPRVKSFRTADGRTLSYRREGSGPGARVPSRRPGVLGRATSAISPGWGRASRSCCSTRAAPRARTGRPTTARTRPRTTSPTSTSSANTSVSSACCCSGTRTAASSRRRTRPASRSRRAPRAREHARAVRRRPDRGDGGRDAVEGGRVVVRGRARRARGRAGRAVRGRRRAGRPGVREFPLYFARYGEAEAAYLDTLRGEVPVADALLLFNDEIFTTFDLRADLPRITAPTLVITGEDDFITGPGVRGRLRGDPGSRHRPAARLRALHLRREP